MSDNSMSDDPIDAVDRALAELRAKFQHDPPLPNKTEIGDAYDELIAKRDKLVGLEVDKAMKAVAAAADALEKVVRSGSTDGLQLAKRALSKAMDRVITHNA